MACAEQHTKVQDGGGLQAGRGGGGTAAPSWWVTGVRSGPLTSAWPGWEQMSVSFMCHITTEVPPHAERQAGLHLMSSSS